MDSRLLNLIARDRQGPVDQVRLPRISLIHKEKRNLDKYWLPNQLGYAIKDNVNCQGKVKSR